ncbi:hypothetical protein O6H91_17G050900 [Diphasiastrum complanatum]|uniref:Uncharacterized protein n=7 Tax=Diphasiastrum complanatum TaxID=34168 RepID=A0ACC2B6N0_DIPCM|nr:hypothetical protein O6H91_17G050900 [Diphasiastrum complanatum]KAJ7525432.1 hypothetical protein O6H91_17G050900 [Diphasiastrum complanatum]KAJ7525433.1 hypothetical protein O6H91_17G050900 [Diphasiastrum complanatum]KAJ7525434.1 hypothetical protein O6H91_17G050900 [Diphasiastrum complanatum]KAJ7525435.1 hypothetical protein O6H91_17G050900 [Diphasiastrum complanatum]
MAVQRHSWGDKKTPSVYVTATGIIFATFLLVGVWLLSFSSQIPSAEIIASDAEAAVLLDRKVSPGGQISEESTEHELPSQTLSDETEPEKNTSHASQSSDDSGQDGEGGSDENDGAAGVSDGSSQMTEKSDELGTTDKGSKSEDIIKEENESSEELPTAAQSELTLENKEASGTWVSQEKESKDESLQQEKKGDSLESSVGNQDDKPRIDQSSLKTGEHPQNDNDEAKDSSKGSLEQVETGKNTQSSEQFIWKLCSWKGATDYIPCLDNTKAIQMLPTTAHYEHRERHCPTGDETPTCLVPLPVNYKVPIHWPESRDRIWYDNVPYPGLVSYKKDQNWVKKKGNLFYFPGGGTQFKQGAIQYINFIENTLPAIEWGKHTRIILDVGCGVASFGGYLFDKNVLTMSFAPKDEHEAQVQLALERGIPAILSVMGTQRLVFPSNSFDLLHCSRCRVPWHVDGGKLLLELNRVLRPGGYFVWSATPVYLNDQEDRDIWKATAELAKAMCWVLSSRKKDSHTGIGVAIFQKPMENSCYELRKEESPPICDAEDNPDAAWYVPMKNCIHKIPSNVGERSSVWPENWPLRLEATPKWLADMSTKGLFGRPAAEEFVDDTQHWKRIVENSYLHGLGIDWDTIRNIMDMKASYGGFAAALEGHPVWVMNVIPTSEPDTLPIIFDRGLLGLYHDWCESFSTYPRTYDLLHADHLFAKLQSRCNIQQTIIEMDRILRPGGWVIFRETTAIIVKVEAIVKSLHWDTRLSYVQDQEQLLVVQKGLWRPNPAS